MGKAAWIEVHPNVWVVETATLITDSVFEDFKFFHILALNKMFLRI